MLHIHCYSLPWAFFFISAFVYRLLTHSDLDALVCCATYIGHTAEIQLDHVAHYLDNQNCFLHFVYRCNEDLLSATIGYTCITGYP